MSRPYGPHAIGPKRQVSIPAEVLRALQLGPGDEVYFEVVENPPGCILLVPVEVASHWWSRGKAAAEQSRGHLNQESGPPSDMPAT